MYIRLGKHILVLHNVHCMYMQHLTLVYMYMYTVHACADIFTCMISIGVSGKKAASYM